MTEFSSLNAQCSVQLPLGSGGSITDATFVERPNRFVVVARLSNGEVAAAHCADRGRLLWLRSGMPLLLAARDGAGRKTRFQAVAAQIEGTWASLDTHLPNRLVALALRQGALPQFAAYDLIRREVAHGASRFDFRLDSGARRCWLEVKSVGVAHDGIAWFPDAPTERGARHVNELASLARSGARAALVFVAQHAAARAVRPDETIDPGFAVALRSALAEGVEVYAYRCPIERDGIRLGEQIPVTG